VENYFYEVFIEWRKKFIKIERNIECCGNRDTIGKKIMPYLKK